MSLYSWCTWLLDETRASNESSSSWRHWVVMKSHSCLPHLSVSAVLAVLLGLMMPSATSGCSCPSCNYGDPVQNCECCVFRQFGKRGTAVRLLASPSFPAQNPGMDVSSSNIVLPADLEVNFGQGLRRQRIDDDIEAAGVRSVIDYRALSTAPRRLDNDLSPASAAANRKDQLIKFLDILQMNPDKEDLDSFWCSDPVTDIFYSQKMQTFSKRRNKGNKQNV